MSATIYYVTTISNNILVKISTNTIVIEKQGRVFRKKSMKLVIYTYKCLDLNVICRSSGIAEQCKLILTKRNKIIYL